MAPGRRRSRRARRTALVLTGTLVVVAMAVAGNPDVDVDDPGLDSAVAAASTPSPTPAANPLAAPATPAGTTPAPRPVDPYLAAQAAARKVTDKVVDEWASFTLLDRRTGKQLRDARAYQTTFTESTVKAWLAADLLATRARAGRPLTPYETARMTAMIRFSDDNAAEVIWRWLGADRAIADMISTCGLEDSQVYPDWWSKTEISARDLARLGDCIVPGKGKLLSPTVGAPLLALMRSVDPTNAFGIQQIQPAGRGVRIAVKNGWTEHGTSRGTQWNVNCLGIWGPGNRWVLAVTSRYPVAEGLDYGAGICRRVTRALLPLTRTVRPVPTRAAVPVPSD